jgi:DNA-binding response OmpR family regulator
MSKTKKALDVFLLETDASKTNLIKKGMGLRGYSVRSFRKWEEMFTPFKNNNPEVLIIDLSGNDDFIIEYSCLRNFPCFDHVQIITVGHPTKKGLSKINIRHPKNSEDVHFEDLSDVEKIIDVVDMKYYDDRKGRCLITKDLVLFPDSSLLIYAGKAFHLTQTECPIMELLMQKNGKTMDFYDIDKAPFKKKKSLKVNTAEAHISNIRKKLGDRKKKVIITDSYEGYYVRSSASSEECSDNTGEDSDCKEAYNPCDDPEGNNGHHRHND